MINDLLMQKKAKGHDLVNHDDMRYMLKVNVTEMMTKDSLC